MAIATPISLVLSWPRKLNHRNWEWRMPSTSTTMYINPSPNSFFLSAQGVSAQGGLAPSLVGLVFFFITNLVISMVGKPAGCWLSGYFLPPIHEISFLPSGWSKGSFLWLGTRRLRKIQGKASTKKRMIGKHIYIYMQFVQIPLKK